VINIGNKNIELLIDEIKKVKYISSITETNHNRIVTEYKFNNNITKKNIISFLNIDTQKYKVLDTLHIIEYEKNSFLSEHIDGGHMLLMVMLEDNFEGGELILEGIDTNFKSKGDVIYIDGSKSH